MILKCIGSCINPVQLDICHDMMLRFKEQFAQTITTWELNEGLSELSAEYLQKNAELAV